MTDYDAQPGRLPPERPRLSTAQREADEVDLRAGLSGLAGLVAGALGVFELLGEVAEFAAHAIPGVDGAGVGLIDVDDEDRPKLQKTPATAEFVHEIDVVQYDELHEGPCITCIQSRRPTVSGSLGGDSRWPRFGGRVARMGVHSALALPLIVGEHVIGAINSYATSQDAFAEHAVQLGSQFAGPAVSIYNAQLLAGARERAEQLQHALESRAAIDQAIGIIRSRTGASAEWAFGRLVRMSQTENTKLSVIAERLIDQAVRRAQARRHQS